MKRIRYTQAAEYITSIPIPYKDDVVYVRIYKDFHVIVINKFVQELASDKGNTLADAKKRAKTLLKRLGINFLDEVRNRKTKLGQALINGLSIEAGQTEVEDGE